MYERYEPTERIFADREKYLDWMTEALTRCKNQSVVLHLRGIGGIGKTALVKHWKRSVEASILLDCYQITDFYERLNGLARGAVRLGIQLRRFDLLWSIRLRFVKGIEPMKEPGRAWALDVIGPLPFIGSMANVAKSIQTIGTKLSPLIRHRFGDFATWLQNRLGKNYSERLLEILWKDPHHAEFLFLDALLEDLNRRKNRQQSILVLLDHFENVDDEHLLWRYGGQQMSETELWYVFLSSLANSVGVMASRRDLSKRLHKEEVIERFELAELDEAGCRELLSKRGVTQTELQTRVISVSGGNPFVVSAICDIAEIGEVSLEDVESLRADTLEEVRLRTWRRLFGQAEGLLGIIDRAGLLPFFNRKTLELVVPYLRTDHWDRLTRLSFVRDRGDGGWELHGLARDLVIAELGDRLPKLALELADRLEHVGTEKSDYTLLGLALSAQALADEPSAIDKGLKVVDGLFRSSHQPEALSLLNSVRFRTNEGKAMIQWLRARDLEQLGRFAEAEQDYRKVLPCFKEFAIQNPDEFQVFVAWTLSSLAYLLNFTGRHTEAIEVYQEAIPLLRNLMKRGERPMLGYPDIHCHLLADTVFTFGVLMSREGRFKEAEAANQEALLLYRELAKKRPGNLMQVIGTLGNLSLTFILSNRPLEAERAAQEAAEIVRRPPPEESEGWWRRAVFASLLFLPLIWIRTGRALEGEGMLREALEHCRELTKKPSGIHMINLGVALNLLGILLRHAGRLTESEDLFQEALDIYRGLHEKEPEFHAPSLAMVLDNLAVLHRQTGRLVEAEMAQQEALRIHRQLVNLSQAANSPHLAIALTNFGVILRHLGKIAQAKAVLREALEIRRSLAAKAPEYFLQGVATTLNNLGVVLAELGDLSKAEEALQKALQLRKNLANKAPSLYLPVLASTLNNLGILLKWTGRSAEAKQAYREALAIRGELTRKAPEVFCHHETQTLLNLAIILAETKTTNEGTEEVMNRLHELGVMELPEVEVWSEDEEDWVY